MYSSARGLDDYALVNWNCNIDHWNFKTSAFINGSLIGMWVSKSADYQHQLRIYSTGSTSNFLSACWMIQAACISPSHLNQCLCIRKAWHDRRVVIILLSVAYNNALCVCPPSLLLFNSAAKCVSKYPRTHINCKYIGFYNKPQKLVKRVIMCEICQGMSETQ